MRKGILVIVNHQPACGAAADERISVVLFRRRVTVGENMRQHVGNGMRPTERADDPALSSRVFLLTDLHTGALFQRAHGRPEGSVRPVGIGGQHRVRVEEGCVVIAEHELAVLGRAGPVHEPCGLEGGGIEAGQRQLVRNAPGNGCVFVRRDRPGERDDEAQAHLFRRMAVGGIECVGVDEGQVEVVQQTFVGIVRIQADQTAVDHGSIVALAVFEIAANEATNVLDVVALALGQRGVFRRRFPGAGGLGQLVQQFAPVEFFVLPLGGLTAPAYGDEELSVMGYVHLGLPPCGVFWLYWDKKKQPLSTALLPWCVVRVFVGMPARSDFLHPIDAVQHAERTARSPSDKQTGHIVHTNHLSNGAGRRRWPSGDSPARSKRCAPK